MMNKKVRAHIYISGMVQGVFFRSNAKEKADELGIFGFMKNLPDGRVEAFFEGVEEKVQKMVRWCQQGPEIAKVEKTDVTWEDYTGEFSDFSIYL